MSRRAMRLRREVALRALAESGRGQRVAVDCSLDHHMSDKELRALAVQMDLTYSANLYASKPFHLFLTGLTPGGRIHQALQQRINNFDSGMFDCRVQSHTEVFRSQDIVYLTPDSENDLLELDTSKVYIIGGLVDQPINRKLTLFKARLAGLNTSRLPVTKFMRITSPHLHHSLDLPINIVASVLLDIHSGVCWPRTLEAHVPQRKGFSLKDNTIDNR